MLGAILCLLFSSIFHLFSSYGKSTQAFLSRLDYSGIALLIAGSTFPPVLYGFACSSSAKMAYIMITSLTCIAAFVTTLMPGADSSAYRKVRGFLFIAAGLLAGLPIIQAVNSADPSITLSAYYWVLGGCLYIVGALFYMARVPERFAPGKFDLIVSAVCRL
eukprot:TRINITY_DN749_c0_g1_i8.p2 TRINITY_DN749_c0_g1~~TRINITY_DN749_c0_g1_i8.p2  ORF type:complete len:162 (+),score=11.54 TRINITY_DN749_c0_g1_i8:393-878(+)